MSQSFRTFGAGALGALIVAVAALTVRGGPASAAPVNAADPATHTISVSATGKVTGEGGTGVLKGITIEISQASRTPRADR